MRCPKSHFVPQIWNSLPIIVLKILVCLTTIHKINIIAQSHYIINFLKTSKVETLSRNACTSMLFMSSLPRRILALETSMCIPPVSGMECVDLDCLNLFVHFLITLCLLLLVFPCALWMKGYLMLVYFLPCHY